MTRHRIGHLAGAGSTGARRDRNPVVVALGGPGAAAGGGDGDGARPALVCERLAGGVNGMAASVATRIDHLQAREAAEYEGLQVEGAVRFCWQVGQLKLAEGQVAGAAFAAQRTRSTREYTPATGQGQATRRLVIGIHQSAG